MPRRYVKSKIIGPLEFRKLAKGHYGACIEDHNPGGVKILGDHYLYILGKPCGYICKVCIAEWIKIWEKYKKVND